jgi:PKD repeat protein
MAIMNWSVPFDDMFQNHFLYQRRSDGRWLLIPWDLDLNFGGWKGANSSLYVGEQNDPDNRSGWWNYLKDGFLKAYRPEFDARLLELTNTLLLPANINALVDGVLGQANVTEASQAPAGVACSFSGDASAFKNFASARHADVNSRLSAVLANAGPDQSVIAGSTVQFDARASRPDPGPGATYAWSNGMAGDFPTFVYATPGTYVVTLTITVSGVPYRDSVTITVVAAPSEAFQESAGRVVFEAENFYLNDRHGAADAWWDDATAIAGYSGAAYMEAMDTAYTKYSSNFGSIAPELRFAVLFQNPGSYRVWIRALSGNTDYDSCHVGLDGSERDESYAQRFTVDADTFLWSVDTREQGVQVVDVPAPGVHFFSIWIRESGQIVDKVVLTTDAAFTPSGAGPAQSQLVPITQSFVRGDANGDGAIDLSDGLAILFFLFAGGSALECEDHGDADDNGSLAVTDALRILNYLFRGGPAPLAPFPAAGRDGTADQYECGN